MAELSGWRREYGRGQLSEQSLAATWCEQFARWFADAERLREPNAVVLATVAANGRPRARTVLLKRYDPRGFVWATNSRSRKGRDLAATPYAGLCFSWVELERQVHAEGPVEVAEPELSDAIFAARPRGAQLAAWASAQSEIVDGGRPALEAAVAEVARRYPDPQPVPRPPHWQAYRLRPESVEFWQGRPDRQHDRLRFRRSGADDSGEWMVERLFP